MGWVLTCIPPNGASFFLTCLATYSIVSNNDPSSIETRIKVLCKSSVTSCGKVEKCEERQTFVDDEDRCVSPSFPGVFAKESLFGKFFSLPFTQSQT